MSVATDQGTGYSSASTGLDEGNSPTLLPPRITGRIRVSRKEIVSLTTQLSIMLQSGVDVSSALKSCARQASRTVLRVMLEDVHDTVVGGSPLSDGLGKYRQVFGETFVASVAAGEASGKLPEVLSQLAKMERSSMRLRGSLRTLLAYPVMLFSVSSLVLSSLLIFVLPQFAQIFSQFDMTLPLVTQMLIGLSSELSGRWWVWFPLGFGVLGGMYFYFRTPGGRRCWDWGMLNLWLIRDVVRNLAIGRVCRLLGIMIQSGVPLLDSIRLARQASTNSYYRELFLMLERDVLNGRGLSGGLSSATFIPPGAADMLATSEQTGTIGEVTEMIGGHYEEEGETKLKEFVTILEPAITVGMGVVIAVVVAAVMLPMFDMAQVGTSGH